MDKRFELYIDIFVHEIIDLLGLNLNFNIFNINIFIINKNLKKKIDEIEN